VDACRYFAGLLVGVLRGVEKAVVLSPCWRPDRDPWSEQDLAPEIYEIAAGSFKERKPPEIAGSGFVVRSLEAALWAFSRASSFRDGCLQAVNLGGDADTTGAVYGQIAGAFWGVDGIPREWLELLAGREMIEAMAARLYHASRRV